MSSEQNTQNAPHTLDNAADMDLTPVQADPARPVVGLGKSCKGRASHAALLCVLASIAALAFLLVAPNWTGMVDVGHRLLGHPSNVTLSDLATARARWARLGALEYEIRLTESHSRYALGDATLHVKLSVDGKEQAEVPDYHGNRLEGFDSLTVSGLFAQCEDMLSGGTATACTRT